MFEGPIEGAGMLLRPWLLANEGASSSVIVGLQRFRFWGKGSLAPVVSKGPSPSLRARRAPANTLGRHREQGE